MSAAPPDDAASAWTEIQTLVDEIAELAERETSTDRFHDEALRRLRDVTAATSATAWVPRDGGFEIARRVGGNGAGNGHADPLLFGRVFAGERAVRVDPPADTHEPNADTRALCPVFAGDEPVGLLEIVQSAETSPASRRSSTQLLEAIAELVGDFHRNRLLAEYRSRERDWAAHRAFCRRVYRGGSRREVAFAVANDGREYADCARLTVLERHGRRWRVLAVSGATRVESRSRVVRRLERLSSVVLSADREFVHVDGVPPSEPLAPQVREVLDEYLEESPARLLHVELLETEPTGDDAARAGIGGRAEFAIVAEHFDLVESAGIRDRMRRLAPDAARALQMARRPSLVERFVAAGLWWGVLAGLVVAGLVLTFVQADFTVPARGTIEPALHRRVFAPRGGFVRDLRTEYGADVGKDELLVELVDPDLEIEWKRIVGEVQKVDEQLRAADLARRPGVPREPGVNPSARYEELKKVRDSLLEQQGLLEVERDKLRVLSPVAGRIVTWDLDRRLHDRPIERGDLLLEVARLDGPWRMRLDIPDDQFGHVRNRRAAKEELRVEYALATEPELVHQATIGRIALTTDTDREGEAIVRAEVALKQGDVPEARPGANVVARIYCGRRSLGYVWFHEAIHAVRTWWYR